MAKSGLLPYSHTHAHTNSPITPPSSLGLATQSPISSPCSFTDEVVATYDIVWSSNGLPSLQSTAQSNVITLQRSAGKVYGGQELPIEGIVPGVSRSGYKAMIKFDGLNATFACHARNRTESVFSNFSRLATVVTIPRKKENKTSDVRRITPTTTLSQTPLARTGSSKHGHNHRASATGADLATRKRVPRSLPYNPAKVQKQKPQQTRAQKQKQQRMITTTTVVYKPVFIPFTEDIGLGFSTSEADDGWEFMMFNIKHADGSNAYGIAKRRDNSWEEGDEMTKLSVEEIGRLIDEKLIPSREGEMIMKVYKHQEALEAAKFLASQNLLLAEQKILRQRRTPSSDETLGEVGYTANNMKRDSKLDRMMETWLDGVYDTQPEKVVEDAVLWGLPPTDHYDADAEMTDSETCYEY